MIVRGAGAIGATGAYGLAQAALQASTENFYQEMAEAKEVLANTRPTAQNLFYGLNAVEKALLSANSVEQAKTRAVEAAEDVAAEDVMSCEQIGKLGAELILPNMRISTHCNAGWLAFVDWGSALSPIYQAQRQGKNPFVYVDETRPRSQGARLTAWELGQEGVKHSVIVDNATGFYISKGKIDMVIVGSDRIARNGDVANKIGTYTSALAAKASGIPFYVAAPTATIDWDCASGDLIPIEERSGDEVCFTWGWSDQGEFMRVRTTPKDSPASNPAFDVTPAELITGIITEKGIFKPSELLRLLN
jgi:S-methyl-5-thioribose-1-phosphate isomerase